MPSKIIDTDVDDAVPLFPNLGEPLVVAVVALNGGSRDLPWHCSSSSSCSCSSVVSVVVGWWWSLLWWLRRRRVQSSAIFVPLVVVLILLYLVTHHPGVRRTIQFWKLTAPLMAEYQWLKFRVRHLALVEQDAILNDYHQRTAPTIFALVVQMRGIFVKIGQIVSSVGIGFVPDAYVLALRPLQDGVPPRTYDQIAAIIEASTGRSMSEVFLEFDPVPIGAASIAQAHRAILRQGREEVVIKVQYPDVAKLFEIDFDNLRALIRIVNPENLDLLHSLRRRHEQELDFTVEAENLREVRRNMQAHKVEPSLVRIPAVKNETGICSSTVLAIEYLPGISLKAAIADEQHRMALGLGMQNADELRQSIADRMRMVHNHPDRSNALLPQESPFNARQAKLLQTFGPAAARVLRVYGGVKEWYGDVWGDKRKDGKSLREKRRRRQHVKLGQAIKTLVHVHGLQMLQDGVFNVGFLLSL